MIDNEVTEDFAKGQQKRVVLKVEHLVSYIASRVKQDGCTAGIEDNSQLRSAHK